MVPGRGQHHFIDGLLELAASLLLVHGVLVDQTRLLEIVE
jgi:hypothetical protein